MEPSCKRVDLTNVIRALPVRLLGSFASIPQTANARFAASISGPPAPGGRLLSDAVNSRNRPVVDIHQCQLWGTQKARVGTYGTEIICRVAPSLASAEK
jgi:hypothetical protein